MPEPKGLHWVRKLSPGKPVRWYCYAWRGGPCIQKAEGGPRPKLSPEGVAALAAAYQGRKAIGRLTVAVAARRWRESPEWRNMAASTKTQWGYKLALIEDEWGADELEAFNDARIAPLILDWRDGLAASPRGADYAVQVLSGFLGWCVKRHLLKTNHAAGIGRLYRGGKRASIVWEEHEREAWQQAAGPVRDAFNLACLTGLRRGDLIALPWEAVKREKIVWEPAKARGAVVVTVPIIPALRRLLDGLGGGSGVILRNEHGKRWTASGLTHAFQRERARLGLAEKHLHDCRGTYATELALAGYNDAWIAETMGWSPTRVATIRRVYVDTARVVVDMAARRSL